MSSPPPSLESPAPVFAALGDPTRLTLVSRLAGRQPLSITRLATGTEVSRQAITKHLHVLRQAGVVRAFRKGREQLWELEPQRLAEARRCLEIIGRQWDSALDRLQRLVEEESP